MVSVPAKSCRDRWRRFHRCRRWCARAARASRPCARQTCAHRTVARPSARCSRHVETTSCLGRSRQTSARCCRAPSIWKSAAPIRRRKAPAACTSSRHRRCGAAATTSVARHRAHRSLCPTRRVRHRVGLFPSAPKRRTSAHPATPTAQDQSCAPVRPHRDRPRALRSMSYRHRRWC